MMKKMKQLNNYAFIDSQNLNLGVRSQGWRLDFGKFRQYLITKYQVKKTYLFIGYIQGNQALYTYLQNVGYICIFKPTLEIKEGKNQVRVKGNVDAELVLHAMIEFNNYDRAVIVSGDGDFHCDSGTAQTKTKGKQKERHSLGEQGPPSVVLSS